MYLDIGLIPSDNKKYIIDFNHEELLHFFEKQVDNCFYTVEFTNDLSSLKVEICIYVYDINPDEGETERYWNYVKYTNCSLNTDNTLLRKHPTTLPNICFFIDYKFYNVIKKIYINNIRLNDNISDSPFLAKMLKYIYGYV